MLQRSKIQEATELFLMCFTAASIILYKYNAQYGKICDSLARCYVLAGKKYFFKVFKV